MKLHLSSCYLVQPKRVIHYWWRSVCAILLLQLSLPAVTFAQNKVWDKTIGGNRLDQLNAMQQTRDGGYILGGWSLSGISGDKSEESKGNEDYWIVKLNADRSKAWDKTIGGANTDQLFSLQQTRDGGYILGGSSFSGISGDKSEANKSEGYYSDYWVVKLNADGTKAWDKTIGGNDTDELFSVQQTSDGGYILAGRSQSDVSGDKTQARVGNTDFWVVKLAADGSKTWDKTVGESNYLTGAIRQTTDGGYIVGGLTHFEVVKLPSLVWIIACKLSSVSPPMVSSQSLVPSAFNFTTQASPSP